MCRKIISILLIVSFYKVQAQETITGTVKLERKPIAGIKLRIKVDGGHSIDFMSDENGKFSFHAPKANLKNVDIKEIVVLNSGYEKNVKYRLSGTRFTMFNIKKLIRIYGRVEYTNRETVPNALITVTSQKITSDANGYFEVLISKKITDINELNVKVSVDDVNKELFNMKTHEISRYEYELILIIQKSQTEAVAEEQSKPQVTEKPELPIKHPPIHKTDEPIEKEHQAVKSIIFQTQSGILPNSEVRINDKIMKTDNQGVINLDKSISLSQFNALDVQIPYHKIIEQKLLLDSIYITLESTRVETQPKLESVKEDELFSSIYKEEFVNIYDEIRTQKQFLQEHNVALRDQIIKMGDKFVNIPNKTDKDAQMFLRYLNELAAQVDLNYKNYRILIDKTVLLIDTIEQNVNSDNDVIKTILQNQNRLLVEDRQVYQNRYIRRYLSVFIIGIFALAAILIIIIYGDRKIRVKNKQLQDSNQALAKSKQRLEHQINLVNIERQKTERAYENIQHISRLGQKVASNLDQDVIIQNTYEDIQSLMQIDEFEVGIFDELYDILRVSKFITESNTSKNMNQKIDKSISLLNLTFKNNHESVINDSNKELSKSITGSKSENYSAIYLPLTMKDKCLGSLGVKKFKTGIYTDNDVDILRAFGNYIAVAIENSNAYKIIKQTNDKMTDSLLYAQKMQKVILPSAEQMKQSFENHFIIYRPKDIVSGDFYWQTQIKTPRDDQATLLAVADCTGHGVPGAFMSILGTRLLDEIIIDENETKTNVILDKLSLGVQKAFKQYEKNNTDGMDIVICLFERIEESIQVTYSSAKMTLYYYNHQDKVIERLKGSNRLIGGLNLQQEEFKVETLNLQKGDTLYLCSDGLLHQNNVERQKFGTRRFLEMLEDIGCEDITKQKSIIESQISFFQSKSDQRDDITLLGIKA